MMNNRFVIGASSGLFLLSLGCVILAKDWFDPRLGVGLAIFGLFLLVIVPHLFMDAPVFQITRIRSREDFEFTGEPLPEVHHHHFHHKAVVEGKEIEESLPDGRIVRLRHVRRWQ